MKKYFLLLVFITFTECLFSQTLLTFRNNGLVQGDSIVTSEIEYFLPGNPGPNQVWDFTGIKFTGVTRISYSPAGSVQYSLGGVDYNFILKEDGRDYLLSVSDTSYTEKGFITENTSIIYSDPIVRLKFPFGFGDGFTDKYLADAVYNKNTVIPVAGDYTVTADATGTLILPGLIIKDALRLHIVKNAFQVNPCSITESKIERYNWYAPGARYPVLSTGVAEHRTTSKEPQRIESAFLNPQQAGFHLVTSESVYNPHIADYSLVTYPNPFTDVLNYVYLLRKPMNVTIELLDVTGKEVVVIENKSSKPDGLQSGEINALTHRLPMGVYNIRFTFGNETILSKVVKM
jgi:hypothetical protein